MFILQTGTSRNVCVAGPQQDDSAASSFQHAQSVIYHNRKISTDISTLLLNGLLVQRVSFTDFISFVPWTNS